MSVFPQYEAYKSSNLDWVEELPVTWALKKGKWLFSKAERPVREEDGVVTAFRDGEVTLRTNRRTDGFTNAIQEHGYQGIRTGDLVIHAMDAFAGAIGVSDSDGKSTPVYAACTPRGLFEVNSYYYAYILRYMAHSGFIESLAKGIRERSTDFRFNDFAGLELPLPPIDTQTRIANFLDQKTKEIDQAIAKKQQLIELLKEQKSILINQAVTKGLNPDALMRDSGVEWIGEIPEHWDVKRLKYFSDVQSGITLGKKYLSGKLTSMPYLRVANVQAGYFKLKDVAELDIPEHEVDRYLLKAGDVLVTEGGDIDKLGRGTVWNDEVKPCLHQNHVFAVRADSGVTEPYFLSLAFESNYGRKYFTTTANKTTNLASTNSTKLGNFPVALPDKTEQKKIEVYCQELADKFNAAVKLEEGGIDLIRQFKDTIISSAVTGKIKI